MLSYRKTQSIYLIYYFVFYFGLLAFNYFHQRLLSQFHPFYFTYNRDLVELALISFGIPKLLLAHPICFQWLDIASIIIPLLQIVYFSVFKKYSFILGVCFSAFLFFYLLLQNLFLQIHLESFVGFLVLSLLFWTKRVTTFNGIIKLTRLLFLYVFFSAALWKIFRGSFFYPEQMQNLLIMHHAQYLSNDCHTFLCDLYRYLIVNPHLAQGLYIIATILELSFMIGWFTKAYDKRLLALALLFFAADHVLMLIPYWQIMVSGITLWPFIQGETKIRSTVKS
jgi:hypothetical protein